MAGFEQSSWWRRGLGLGSSLLLVAVVTGCGADGDFDARDVGPRAGDPDANHEPPGFEGPNFGGGGAGMTDDGLEDLPEEAKDLNAFRAPVATGDYLWFVNPDSNRVALIDAEHLEVQVLNGGHRPTYVAAVPSAPGSESALVINAGSHSATWFRHFEDRIETVEFPLHEGANRWTVASSGRWAVAWSAVEPNQALDPTDGLQDVTVVDLEAEPPATQRLTVGYRPQQVGFSEDEKTLIVVALGGISVIDLTATPPATVRLLDVGGGSGRGVAITPDGDHALVHRSSSSTVQILSLRGAPPVEVELSGPVTDLGLSADGTRAVAVVREQRQIAVLELPGVLDDPEGFETLTVPGEVFGSVALSADGLTAALYTTAVDHGRLVLVDLRNGAGYLTHRTVDVRAPVTGVQPTPDGEHAIVLMGRAAGSEKPGSFSLVALREQRFPRVEGTGAPIHQVAVSAERAVVTTRNDQSRVYESFMVQMPSGQVDVVRLSSPPTAVGILSDLDLGYVAQSHPEGRVTILSFASGRPRTLTGFELASKIVE